MKKQTQRSIERPVTRAKKQDDKARVKAIDSFQNFNAQLGMGTDNLAAQSTYGFNPITRNRIMLEWIHRGSWLGGVAIDVVADDMTRAGVDLKGDLKPDQIEKLHEHANALNIANSINENIKWARLYGGSIAVMLLDGQQVSSPLRIETVDKDQFKGLLVLDRWMLEPSLNDVITDMGPMMGMPKFYRVLNNAPGLIGKKIHYTRVLRLDGVKLPYQQKMTENLWSISVLERLYDRMVAFDSATTGAAQLVYKSYLRTIKVAGLRELVATGGPALQGLTSYVDMMRRFQSIEGITMLDGDDTFEGHVHGAFSGLSDALIQFGQQLGGALQIPLVRLFGQSPAGMNSTGESDLRMYYDGILQQQNATLLRPLTAIYRCIAASIGIQLPEGFSVAFRPLWQLTDGEKSTIAQTVTTAVTGTFEAGIVSQKTAMQELKQSSNVTGVWSNITAEDIEAASEELAPPAMEEEAPGAEGEEEKDKPEKKKVAKDSASELKTSAGAIVKAGMAVKLPSTARSSGLVGKVIKINSKNVVLETSYQARPDGPWYTGTHTIPRSDFEQPGVQVKDGATSASIKVMTVHDLQTVIENPKGSIRRGADWQVLMPADYGYIRATNGADGDQVDCYIGPDPAHDSVHIIDQQEPGTGKFDEHKVMLGYKTSQAALVDYLTAFSDGSGMDRLGAMNTITVDDLKKWLTTGDITKPFSNEAIN